MKSRYTHHIIELVASLTFILLPLILFPTVQQQVFKVVLTPPLQGALLTHSLLVLFYYFNFYFLIPRYYFQKKKLAYGLPVIGFLILLTIILISHPEFNPFPSPPFKFAELTFLLSILLRFLLVMVISLGVANIQKLKQAESEKIKAELSFLKAQINPHFLFNTLNSIYALSVKKSEQTSESITKLSAIMRYVISDAANDLVPLEKEFEYIGAYISLEKLRLTSKVLLKYEVTGDFGGKKISPLIFIPLIENAFKHGVSTKEDCKITINITVRENSLYLNVENKIVRTDNKLNNGLGIENVKRRLDLLYPGAHTLLINKTESHFTVNLNLILND